MTRCDVVNINTCAQTYQIASSVKIHTLGMQQHMDTLGIEPRASRMLSGCDTTTPCARCIPLHCCTQGVSLKLAAPPFETSLALAQPCHFQSRPPSNLEAAPSCSVAGLWPWWAKNTAPVHKCTPLGRGNCGNLPAKTSTGVHYPSGAGQQ